MCRHSIEIRSSVRHPVIWIERRGAGARHAAPQLSRRLESLHTFVTWSGGVPPYTLTLQPGDQPNAPPLQNFGVQTGSSYSWHVTQDPGTIVSLLLRDSNGALSLTAPFMIMDGGPRDEGANDANLNNRCEHLILVNAMCMGKTFCY